ncbi:mannose-6-phosphate isomerase, class I [Marinococcus sp. PL1-022]|uniref:mannose-6-phosphate isomerase, class I n=1 Tax=Marinococcus sp. PL1-022 TaxID=3095363 RepID=UPI0029C172BA|nr:mannose-6-phosphate isomerase, class I [Marinococcus sp. PL1-022]MDX6153906.1 mannose-6-phosphate isomerase, class I [Marinococcus sp. PL1-022]
MDQFIFFKPIFQERIWGGDKLHTHFHYDIPSASTGEAWVFAAHQNGSSVVANGSYAGKTLMDLWQDKREWFGSLKGDRFPLLTKILDAARDLSVQVHPDNQYAAANENGEYGKTECWYVIDCDEDAELVIGHNADSRSEATELIAAGEWDAFLRKVPVKPGDFVYVPSGTMHAIGESVLILETQQNSDVTYRVYDYDRTDNEGNKRELHLQQALDVTHFPHEDAKVEPSVESDGEAEVTTFVEEDYFSVYKWEVHGTASFTCEAPFLLCSVIEGSGTVDNLTDSAPIQKGDHFLVPNHVTDFTIDGHVTCIVSHPNASLHSS